MRALSPALALAMALTSTPGLFAAPSDSPLTGTWRIQGPTPAKGHAADLGELKVDASGSYQWSEGGHLSGLGALQPHHSSGGARSGEDCWLFHRGRGDMYAFRVGNELEIYDAASNTLLGVGSKPGVKAAPKHR